jgi:hypothetical protein
MATTEEVLKRLNRRLGREAARHERWSDDALARGSLGYAEKTAGQANVLRLAQGFVRDEIQKLRTPKR